MQASTPLPTDLLLWLPLKEHTASLSRSLSHSLCLWKTVCKIYSIMSSHTLVALPSVNLSFPPDQNPQQFTWCVNKGLYRIGHFKDHKAIRKPSYFLETLQMPPMEMFCLTIDRCCVGIRWIPPPRPSIKICVCVVQGCMTVFPSCTLCS